MDVRQVYFDPQTPLVKKKRHIRLTSLFFTAGLALFSVNLLLEIINFAQYQPHAIGGAVVSFVASIVTAFTDQG